MSKMGWKQSCLFILVMIAIPYTDGEECSQSLGASLGGNLLNSAFTASSSFRDYTADKGRLGNPKTAWIPKDYSPKVNGRRSYLQIDLGEVEKITSVQLQGFQGSSSQYYFHVTFLYLVFSKDGIVFDYYRYGKPTDSVVFRGNSDFRTIAKVDLHCPVYARFIRFEPLNFVNGIALNVDVLGCMPETLNSTSVTNLHLNFTNRKLTIVWTQVKLKVQLFHLHIPGFVSGKFIPARSGQTLPIKYTEELNSLTPCKTVFFILRVYDDSKCGVPEVIKHKYKTPPKPLAPQNIKVDTSTPLTIKLSWEKPALSPLCPNPEDSLSGYKIVYTKTSSLSDFNQVKVSANDLHLTIANLESWTKYDVKIFAMNDLYQSDSVSLKDVDVSGKPPEAAPQINLLVSETPRTLLLQWKNPDAEKINGVITGYKVHYRVRGKEDWVSLNVLKGDNDHHSMKIIGTKEQPLQPWKYYEVYVTLFNQKYNISSVVKDVLVIGSGPGAAPENVITSKVTENSCILKWDAVPNTLLPPKGVFLGYKIFFNAENSNQRSYSPNNIKETTIKIENLKPDTKYLFSIAGETSDKVGPLSAKVAITTAAGPLPPPVVLTHESREANTFYLNWKIESEVPVITRLVLRYKKKEHIDTWISLDVVGKRNVTINNLLPWQQYDAKLDLESDGRKSSSSLSPVMVKGKVPGKAPTNLHMIDHKYKYIALSWDSVDPRWVFGTLVDYVIKYGVKENGATVDVIYTQDTNLTIINLIPGTEYNFQVAGRTNDGSGVFSDTLVKSTKKLADPGIPQNAVAHNVSPTKVKIRCSVMGDISIFVVKLKNLATGMYKDVEYHISTVTVIKVSNHEYSLVVTAEAFTEYQIQLKSCIFDKCSQFSKKMIIRTSEDAPSEVRNLQIVESAVDDPVVTWRQPEHVPGIIRYYKMNVLYADGISVENFPVELDNNTFKMTLRNLPHFSELQLALHAVTIKPGPMIEKKFKSPQGLPSEPRNILVVGFRKYGMSLKWEEPVHPNGYILGYRITYEGTKYYRADFKVNESVDVAADVLQPYRIHDLVPGTTYKVALAAKTVRGFGPFGQAKREILTAVKKPDAPKRPIPVANSRSSSTITVYLQRAVQEYGPIKWYQLILEERFLLDKPSSKKKRSVNFLPKEINGYSVAKEKGEQFYIAAVVSNQQVPGRFVLGNDKDYNHYRNHPLKPATNYGLHIRAVTEDNKRQYYGDVVSISLPTTLAVKKEWNESSILIPVIVGVAGGILMIILCVVIFVRCKRNARSKKEAADYDQRFFKMIATPEEAEEMLPKQQNDTYPTNPDYPPISAAQFAKHVAKLHRNNNSGFKTEYTDLKIGKEFPWDVAHLLENKPKNRYDNIVAYDHSRVKLSMIYDVPGSDYINASYIDGYRKPNGYVPTQGPLPNTYNDFWRMVWELKSTCIVMLTNLQEKNKLKCHKYWPDDSTDYGDIKVTMLRYDPYADFTIRTFQLEDVSNYKPGEAAMYQVRQFHFTSWPDHGVPQHPTSLLNFRRKVRSYEEPHTGPTIVHCSAGVGRTGAYIAIDSMLERVHFQTDIDVFNFIANMRMRRIAMVQTEDQYVFVHDSVVESLTNGNTEVTIHGLREAIRGLDQIDHVSKVSGFEMQWKTLNHTNAAMHKSEYVVGLQGDNAYKNRYSTVLPTESSRVLLLPLDEIESSTYINAVYVDSYKQKNAFILTQSPLPRTVFDFWRMVSEHGTSSIVMLNALDEGDDYAKFWPDSGRRDYDMITVECVPDVMVDDIDITSNNYLKPVYRTPPTELVIRCFQITDKRNPSKSITARLFQYIGWTETRVPNTYRPVISLLSQIERWQQQSGRGPITIMCSDGIGRSGALAAIIYVLERVKLTQVFDAFQAIKALRIQRQHAVKYMDQFKYIYFAVQEYLSAFEEHTKL